MKLVSAIVLCTVFGIYSMRFASIEPEPMVSKLNFSTQQPLSLVDLCAARVMQCVHEDIIHHDKDNVFVYKDHSYVVNDDVLTKLAIHSVRPRRKGTLPSLLSHITSDHKYGFVKKKSKGNREHFDLYRIALQTNEKQLIATFGFDDCINIYNDFVRSVSGRYALIKRAQHAEFIDIETSYKHTVYYPNNGILGVYFIGNSYIILSNRKELLVTRIASPQNLIEVGKVAIGNKVSLSPIIMHDIGCFLLQEELDQPEDRVKYALVNAVDLSVDSRWCVKGRSVLLRTGGSSVDETSHVMAFHTAHDCLQVSSIPYKQMKELQELSAISIIKHPGSIAHSAFANDGRWLFTGGDYTNGKVCLWEVKSACCLWQWVSSAGNELLPIIVLSVADKECFIEDGAARTYTISIDALATVERMRQYLAERKLESKHNNNSNNNSRD